MTGRTEELGDVAVWTSGGTPPRGLSEYWSGTIPWISAATLRESHISTSTQFLTTSGVEAGSKIAPTGSTLILVRGMALHHELRVGIATRDLAFNQDVKALIPLPFVEPEFLTYAILGKTPEILSLVSSAGSGTGVLNSDRLKKIQIWIPSRDEQICVVSRINDLDVLVGSLAATIAKKRAIKQGMMQELLTGRTRLRGFEGEWGSMTLGSVCRIKTGARNNQDKVPNGAYPFFVRSATVERIDSYSYDTEAILVPGEGGIGTIFHYIKGRFEVHQRVYKVSDFASNVSGKFVYYFMRVFFGSHAMENSVKATVDSLRLPTFKSFELRLPPTRAEQEAIVEVLEVADAEIEALEKRLEATRQIKEGMMQELLTGRTRLV